MAFPAACYPKGHKPPVTAPSGDWILATGFWADSGVWDDTSTWID